MKSIGSVTGIAVVPDLNIGSYGFGPAVLNPGLIACSNPKVSNKF